MRNGFTLAEILITLGIIGVVAAMALSTLIQNNTEEARVAAFKKHYSTLNQAYQKIVFGKSTPEIWLKDCENTKDCSEKFADEFKEYLNIGECKVALNDGTGLMIYADNTGGANIKIDDDGFKGDTPLEKIILFLYQTLLTK